MKRFSQFIILTLSMSAVSSLSAAILNHSMGDYTSYPAGVVPDVVPKVMLMLSKNHQIWEEAYSDYDDIDGDGERDLTYDNTIEYIGYFDSNRCYLYRNVLNQFEAAGYTTDHLCQGVSGSYSGNFMNWATMTRIDMVRKVMYGGKRVVDTAGLTVLERANLPADGHSFAKYYEPDGSAKHPAISQLLPSSSANITICNTTLPVLNQNSHDTNSPPVVRFAEATDIDIDGNGTIEADERDVNFRFWDINERWQCMWGDGDEYGTNSPSTFLAQRGGSFNENDVTDPAKDKFTPKFPNVHVNSPSQASAMHANGLNSGAIDHHVKIKVCDTPGVGIEPDADCKRYPDGNFKPIGVLQEYGELDDIHFGLMTGSYYRNISGGVLRKNIESIDNEINESTNGTFTSLAGAGIIATLDKLRIYGYEYGDYVGFTGNNPGSYIPISNCNYNMSSLNNDQCHSWGNPIGEMFVETLRYFSGKTPTTYFDVDDSVQVDSSLPKNVSWEDPLDEHSFCAPLNVMAINANISTYDDDDYAGFSTLDGNPNIDTWTNMVGDVDHENLNGQDVYIGVTASENNEYCDSKELGVLSDAKGICPKGPTKEGTYKIAGAAYFAYTNDIRNDLSETQRVKTFAINLEGGAPVVDIPVPASTDKVSILPAMRNRHNGSDGGGTLMSFKILDQTPTTGRYLVAWEDSEQGGDYDMDMWGILDYAINGTDITVGTEVIGQATPSAMAFGFVLDGTNNDGFKAYSGTSHLEEFECLAIGGDDNSNGTQDCNYDDPRRSMTFALGNSTTMQLEDPLFYAAKWGGFEDDNDNLRLDGPHEWDVVTNANNLQVPDGIPDNYFSITNPKQLKNSVSFITSSIAATNNYSLTQAPLGSGSYRNVGLTIKTAFDTKLKALGSSVSWAGSMFAVFTDQFGYLREDLLANQQLDNYDADPVIEITYINGKTQFYRISSTSPTRFEEDTRSGPFPISELSKVWDVNKSLAEVTDVINQRNFDAPTTGGRYIFTGIDTNNDNMLIDNETMAFTAENMDDYYHFLDVLDEDKAEELVNYIRGDTTNSAYRNRTLVDPMAGTQTKYLMGDIAGSNPMIVGRPAEQYDVLYRDESYADFARKYRNRRHMVYVGANDGMLHAINMGYYEESTNSYKPTSSGATATGNEPALGAETWAYVPQAALPHLQWFADPTYRHTAYVDGPIKAFDAQIFSNDSIHPNGWGTILVVNMGFGGAKYTIDADKSAGGVTEKLLSSSIMVFDVTDPKQEPTLLAEISHPDLGMTIGEPAVVHKQDSGVGHWYLVFGSGPTADEAQIRDALIWGSSNQNAKLFAWNLKTRPATLDVIDIPNEENTYVGKMTTVDWELDRNTDAIYFGTAGYVDNDTSKPLTGNLYRISTTSSNTPGGWSLERVVQTDQPITTPPTVAIDDQNNRWVFASSGRLLVSKDLNQKLFENDRLAQQSIYGIVDNNEVTKTKSSLVDVTNAVIKTDGSVANAGGANNFSELLAAVNTAGGWHKSLPTMNTSAESRVNDPALLLGSMLYINAYKPSGDVCVDKGQNAIYGLFFRTGTAHPANNTFLQPIANDIIEDNITISEFRGSGLSASIEYQPVRQTSTYKRFCPMGQDLIKLGSNTRTGALIQTPACVFGPINSGEVSWREVIQ